MEDMRHKDSKDLLTLRVTIRHISELDTPAEPGFLAPILVSTWLERLLNSCASDEHHPLLDILYNDTRATNCSAH